MNHEPVNAGIANTRVGVAHDTKARGYIAAGVFLVVGQNGQSRYIDIFAGENHLLNGSLVHHDRRLGGILASSILTNEFRQGGIFEPDGPEQAPGVGMNIGYDRQRRPFDFFEDDDGKFSLLLQFRENTRYLEVGIDFPLDAEYLVSPPLPALLKGFLDLSPRNTSLLKSFR